MDLHMPVMGGLEAARKLRFLPNGRTVPVIALTADVRPAVVEDCRDAGMVAHVGKPFDPARLLALIEEHIHDAT
jgi:CheY-like chemotaxis protein